MRDLSSSEDLARFSGRHTHDATLLKASTELFVQAVAHDRDEIRRFEELATHLIPRVAPADRIFAAERLAIRIDAPPSVMRMLARDILQVAEPVLRRSPVLAPLDLLSVIAATGPEHHRLIAERPGIAEDVERALRIAADPVVVGTLDERRRRNGERPWASSPATSAEADWEEDSHAAAGDASGRFVAGARTRRPLMERRIDLAHFLSLDRQARLMLMGEIANRPPAETASGTARRLDRAFRSILDAAQIVSHARAGRRLALIQTIGEGLRMAPDDVVACLDDPGGEPLAVLLKALSLDRVQAQQVMLIASPVGRDTTRFFKLCDLFAGMEPLVAETLSAAWQIGATAAPPRHQPFADTRDPARGDTDAGRANQAPAERRADGRG
jgi:uncharacterized protein (DUF2336 family)